LCERLVAKGHAVRVLDDLSTGKRDNLSKAMELMIGSVADPAVVRRAMVGMDGCFHLAAIASVQRSVEDWLGTHATNLAGAIAVFDAARANGSVPVVYASSAAVYGDNPDMPLAETSATSPLSAYGADKFSCELHGRVATLIHGVPTTGFRFFNVFGPRQDPHSPYSGVISIFIERLLKGQPLTVFGDGSQSRDFVYVGDVVDHLVAAMENPGKVARVFNVCTGRSTTLLQLIDTLGELLGVVPDVRFTSPRAGDIKTSLGNPAACQHGLGVVAATPLKEGLAATIPSRG
jgi:UDP-glucose 4-epimerase